MTNYAIVCTGSWGDVINTTPLAAQIKAENPNDQVHWYVSTMYASALHNNPHIDKVVTIPAEEKSRALWECTDKAKLLVKNSGFEYRTVFAPAPYANHHWGEQRLHIIDCIRQSCMDAHPNIQWKVPWIPVLKLFGWEVENAVRWKDENVSGKLAIFEYDAKSGQSHINWTWVQLICDLFKKEKWTVALAGMTPPPFPLPSNVKHANKLSIRETAELFNHADFMVGVSSGISAACSSTWTLEKAKTMPWVEICNNTLWSGSIYKHAPRVVYTGDNPQTVLSMIRPLV